MYVKKKKAAGDCGSDTRRGIATFFVKLVKYNLCCELSINSHIIIKPAHKQLLTPNIVVKYHIACRNEQSEQTRLLFSF